MNNLNLDTVVTLREELQHSPEVIPDPAGEEFEAHSPLRGGLSYDDTAVELKDKSDDEVPLAHRYRSQSQLNIELLTDRESCEEHENDLIIDVAQPCQLLQFFVGKGYKPILLTEERKMSMKILRKLKDFSILRNDASFTLPENGSIYVTSIASPLHLAVSPVLHVARRPSHGRRESSDPHFMQLLRRCAERVPRSRPFITRFLS